MTLLDRFRHAQAPLREYLYIDHGRLNSYLDQISSTNTHDKVKSLRVGVSMSGPSAGAEQTAIRRDKTSHEKVSELTAYLERQRQLGRARPSLVRTDHDDLDLPDFVLEECDAVRVLIPSGDAPQPSGVVVWLSEWPLERPDKVLRPPGVLCIIEDSTQDDMRHRAGFSHSGYTWLQALLYQLHQQPSRTRLAAQYPLVPVGEYLHDLMWFQPHLRSEMSLLRPNPLGWLHQRGCVLSLPRRVTVLYRIRNLGCDEINTKNRAEDFTITTFAYGIALWAQPNKAAQWPRLRRGR